ncbi:MMACHC [Symbiodinium natans]|uniref:Cyanocobalamin reductase (cyanide-eliminating) n=1 Tax=Symbiodinium natans TaxID=878477 RepID=A0A812JBB4_9DINO|nr:MMACHC [Symbiodinium natans]
MGGSQSTFQGFHFKEDAFDAEEFQKALSAWLTPMCLDCSRPFLIGWYNQARGTTADGTQQIQGPDDAVAYAIYSVPGYLDVVIEHYARERPSTGFIDGATDAILAQLRQALPAELEAEVVNTDAGPPYYHVQTIGNVCAEDEHLEAKDVDGDDRDDWQEDLSDQLEETRDPKMWGTESEMRRKIFGVNVHPIWGGWYSYRALIVLRKATQASLPQPKPLAFLATEDKKRILAEYNLRHQLCLWRDLADSHPPEKRYSPEEFFFFTETSPDKRRRFLEMKAAHMKAVPPPRWP